MFHKNYVQTACGDVSWGLRIRNDFIKRHMRKFRVPYCMFEETRASLRDEGHHKDRKCWNGWPKVVLESLVLASLRLLGSGCTFDLAEEFARVSANTIHAFF